MADLPTYRNILLATDGSAASELATRHAMSLARQLGSRLMVLYVVDRHMAFMVGIHRSEALQELRREGEAALAATRELAQEAGLEIESRLEIGRPGEVITGEADRLPADLLVMGSHGQGGLTDILLGSVTQYVVHHAQVPVCIVRAPGT